MQNNNKFSCLQPSFYESMFLMNSVKVRLFLPATGETVTCSGENQHVQVWEELCRCKCFQICAKSVQI